MKCTICTAYCPVVPVNPAYPGPKQAGPDGARLRLKDAFFYDEALKYCMNCKRCEVACPSDVRIADIIQQARLDYSKTSPKLRDRLLANTDFMGTMARPFAPIVNTMVSLKPVKAIMDGVLAIDHRRMFPKYAGRSFESWFKKEAAPTQGQYKNQISYFHGCYVNYNYPQLGKDFVKVMNAIGYGVNLLEKEKCCGVALISNGMIPQAKKNAEHNVKALTKGYREHGKIITTSSTCTLTMKDEYPHLLKVDNSEIQNEIDLVTKFIFTLYDRKEIKLAFKKDYKKTIAYHTPCHMEKLGWGVFSAALIRRIPGVKFTILNSNCCGIAGTYGFKKENYEASQAIGNPLFEQINSIDPDFVACDCETCKWQIEMSTKYKVKHPISILAEALDLEETAKLNA